MITNEQRNQFAEYRENINDDIALWAWLFQKKKYNLAADWLLSTIEVLEKMKQPSLLGRYWHNLGVTYYAMKLPKGAHDAFRHAYRYDFKRYGKTKAKKMMAYRAMNDMRIVLAKKKGKK